MSRPSFSERIRLEPAAIGTVVTLESPTVAEALALAGIDWLFIDMEHGPLDIGAIQVLVRATPARCYALVRVPENTGMWIKRVLDTGCDGVIVPQILSGRDARAAVAAAKYPPVGHRSVGVGRAHAYGQHFDHYVAHANQDTSVIIQIEHIAAIEHLDDILGTPGIAGIFIGPYDLSGSMGRLGDVGHPDVRAAIGAVRDACRVRNMPVGLFLRDPGQILEQLAGGLNFLAVGSDVSYLMRGAAEIVASGRRQTS